MEDGAHGRDGSTQATVARSPPPAPNPNARQPSIPNSDTASQSDSPLRLTDSTWNIQSTSALSALRTLSLALESLSEATGDVPPTPPISRPTTPMRRASSPLHAITNPFEAFPIGSPEAHPHEAIATPKIGADAEEHYIQHTAIARRFFSKTAPGFSIGEYLERMHKWCPHSPGVYLAAAHYITRLCVTEFLVPATSRTVHRLALAAIRIAAKVLEDHKWAQERVAKVGGISRRQLLGLEVALCFLLDFDLWVDESGLASSVFALQQAARHGGGVKGSLREGFRMAIPARKRPDFLAVAS
ncbi:hypothetical protein B0A48_12076 [Cryoendolithus antarcticus]|uniref:Cyclin-domain-containing protein n=1 Tax=Cryoendolithus antarcticus TaxID=1507870 RepID=A0A1V8SU01_9PEZI|nr:hypothetical protein B0A48_12076 [Cryoendolithus antarcticus]